jgi:Arc/MetJ-type ribon-helix-helix transcriptional regulator
MSRFTIRLDDDLTETIEDAVERGEFDTKAEAVRHYLRRGLGRDDVEAELEAVKAERDELRNQLQAVTRQQRDVDDLVEYVEEERQLQRRRADRERQKETANVLRRAKWWLTGMPDDE